VSVQWRPPAERELNGIIRGYRVYYVELNDLEEPVFGAQPVMLDLADGSKTDVVVTGLLPDTRYQFLVAAYTRKGEGERTKPKQVRTKGAGESDQTKLKIVICS